MKISAQLYTVRQFMANEEGIAETLKKVKEIGYDAVQLSGLGPHSIDFLVEELKKNNLEAHATHVPYKKLIENTDQVIEEHLKMNCKLVGLGYKNCKDVEEVHAFLDEILPVSRKFKEAGLQFVYHNHHFDYVKLENGKKVIDMFLENTSPDEFGILADVYWLHYSGVNPTKFIKENKDRIKMIHIKDLTISNEYKAIFAPVGEGNMDYASVIKTCDECGILYGAVEQDECYGEDPFECLMRSKINLDKIM